MTARSMRGVLAQAEVQAALVLRRVAAAAGDLLHLLLAVPEQLDLRADGAAVALGPFELELDPVVVLATVFL